jgi:hypothetical protein
MRFFIYLFLYYFGLWGYWHCGHSWPIVPTSGDSEDDCGKQMECRLAGETEVLGENLPQHHFCPSQNPTWPDPGLNLGRRSGKSATNHLSYGAALFALVAAIEISGEKIRLLVNKDNDENSYDSWLSKSSDITRPILIPKRKKVPIYSRRMKDSPVAYAVHIPLLVQPRSIRQNSRFYHDFYAYLY